MKKYIYEGKTQEEAIDKCINELNEYRENLIIGFIEENNKLLKKNVKVEVIKFNDLIDEIRSIIKDILSLFGLEANLEIMRKEDFISVVIDSNNNSLLIGKNGKNLKSLQEVMKQIVLINTNGNVNINLDISDYKKNRERNLIRIAKETAKEVKNTNIEVKLSNMNSYERRIIHNVLSQNKYVYTESVGEEPNRCVVIKPKQ